ncbi:transglycosylase domain-containing protein [Bacillus alveayuensis]|uniref:transglycosylase domain-containing protein n=1 Tax=Aeribacillus alveayuensis TaxID=279215 RepID=UPI0005CCB322|nr:transglycosylase domain-containing protein [Bacillus alveayuensis]
MRAIIGYLLTLFTLSCFYILILKVGEEWNNVKPVSAVIEEKIQINDIHLQQNSYIYDRNNKLISEHVNEQKRKYISLKEIPDIVKQIFILTEDSRFYEHSGFDIAGVTRAAIVNAKSGSLEQGGSTITQQLARNLFLNHEKTWNRKFRELLYSYQLEENIDKDRILELYLNAIYFQNGVYGIETAAQYYFSRPLEQLSIGELAFICAIPNNPSLYDPLTHFKETKKRQEHILQILFNKGIINKETFDTARSEQISLRLQKPLDLFPDYVTYVYHELKQLLAFSEGISGEQLDKRVSEVLQSGVRIYTSLDPGMQQTAIKAVQTYLPYKNVQGAVVVIDHTSNEIIALTGGKHYKKFDFHRAFQAYRQPGSVIKPLLVYGPYIDLFGATPYSLINADSFCKHGYCPKNYSNRTYGMITLETALQYSYNTPAVRMLDKIGIEQAFSYLQKFAFSGLTKEDYVLPAAVGGFTKGMTPLELTNAYTTFAHDGIFQKAYAIRKVTDLQGNVLYERPQHAKKVWSKKTNDIMRELLAKVVKEGTAKKAYFTNSYIGGKTGTTNDYKDLWFIGLTNHYTAGVWIGQDKPASIEAISKQTPHLHIWKTIMQAKK